MTEKDIADELMKEAAEFQELEEIVERALMSADPPTNSDIRAATQLLLLLEDELQDVIDEIGDRMLDLFELQKRQDNHD